MEKSDSASSEEDEENYGDMLKVLEKWKGKIQKRRRPWKNVHKKKESKLSFQLLKVKIYFFMGIIIYFKYL